MPAKEIVIEGLQPTRIQTILNSLTDEQFSVLFIFIDETPLGGLVDTMEQEAERRGLPIMQLERLANG